MQKRKKNRVKKIKRTNHRKNDSFYFHSLLRHKIYKVAHVIVRYIWTNFLGEIKILYEGNQFKLPFFIQRRWTSLYFFRIFSKKIENINILS